jgi:hypothetical protein
MTGNDVAERHRMAAIQDELAALRLACSAANELLNLIDIPHYGIASLASLRDGMVAQWARQTLRDAGVRP